MIYRGIVVVSKTHGLFIEMDDDATMAVEMDKKFPNITHSYVGLMSYALFADELERVIAWIENHPQAMEKT